MTREIDFTNPGLLYTFQDTVGFLQEGWAGSLDALASVIGEKVIVQGLNNLGGGIYSNGWVAIGGELIKFAGGAFAAYMFIDDQTTTEQYDDGSAQNCYTTKELKFTAVAGGNIPFTDFKRLPYNSADIYSALNSIKTLFKAIVIEAAVIMQGCVVTNVVGTTTGTCDISAGIALIDGEYVIAPARVGGAFPCWLKPDGTYVTAAPGGTFIKFDYETSQRYVDVLRRNTNSSGSVLIHRVLNNRFDVATGLGKWEWLGWKICDPASSSVLLGYSRAATNPGDGIWDSNYHGVNNTGGSNKHVVEESNIQEFTVTIDGSNTTGGIGYAVAGNDHTDGTIDIKIGVPIPTPIDHRMPYLVVLYLERI